uniref:Uncharacterized protein n=1 Tax=Arundo donax TaxID=35708 RepID=A0A0A9C9K8_ARUDO
MRAIVDSERCQTYTRLSLHMTSSSSKTHCRLVVTRQQ